LKPSNILVERRPDGKIVLRVTDFGIGGLAAQPVLERSRSSPLEENMASVLTGSYSPLYASPQQMRGDNPDPRDDVYALGVIWYQLLTGDLTSPAPTGRRWVDGLRRQGMSDAAVDLLSSCFESDPAHRPDDAGMLADLLQKLPHSASTKPADAASELPLAEAASSVFQKASSPPRKIKVGPVATPAQREPAPPPRTESKPASRAPQAPRREAPAVSAQPEPFLGWFDGARRWVATGLLGLAGLLGVILYITTDNGTMQTPKHAADSRPRAGADSRAPSPSDAEYVTTRVGQIKLKRIPAATFQMGSPDRTGEDDEHPQHEVRITRPFYLGVTEVTQAQYEAVMGNNPSHFSATGGGKDKVAGQSTEQHPVEQVSWLDAVKFCNKLSELEGRKPFYEIEGERVSVPDWLAPGYRLPTEAEWEYACGGDPGDPAEFAWFSPKSESVTHAVSRKRANRFGLYDMLGNVWEWCWDRYEKDYYKQLVRDDPTGPDAAGAAGRVIRGGSWYDDPGSCRSANRDWFAPDRRDSYLGFRVARVQSPR